MVAQSHTMVRATGGHFLNDVWKWYFSMMYYSLFFGNIFSLWIEVIKEEGKGEDQGRELRLPNQHEAFFTFNGIPFFVKSIKQGLSSFIITRWAALSPKIP